uniref:Uncharacterized protein n=1 Tax=Panagrolaimus davidi TaxID=227884 RepID=A0A914QXQ4_9BILA
MISKKATLCTLPNENASSIITAETVNKLLNTPYFFNLDRIELVYIPETFDVDTFYGYIKKNTTTLISIKFCDAISQAYKNSLEETAKEILFTQNRQYKTPLIDFAGISHALHNPLFCAFCHDQGNDSD